MDEDLRRAEREGDAQRIRALRRRAGAPVCGHDSFDVRYDDIMSRPRAACRHLLEGQAAEYVQRLLGRGDTCELLCPDCREEGAPPDALWEACDACLIGVLDGDDAEWIGTDASGVEIATREGELRLEVRETKEALLESEPVAMTPLPGAADSCLILALTADRTLHRLDLVAEEARRVGQVPEGVDLSGDVTLCVAQEGTLVAVAERRGQRGLVLEVAECKVLLSLDRGDYHVDQCDFPLAFVEREGRTLLVHATAWNRLHITDPRTGERLTDRAHEAVAEGERPTHYLDYFHCGLLVSPDGRRIAEDGWVWAPMGVTRWWSLERWLSDDPWESEDGPSVRSLVPRAYLWDTPLCWADPKTLVVWGYGEDDDWVLDAAGVVDTDLGRVVRWIHGVPRGRFSVDEHLFVCSDRGTSVWDLATGERLLEEPRLANADYHPTARCVYSRLEDGRFRLGAQLRPG